MRWARAFPVQEGEADSPLFVARSAFCGRASRSSSFLRAAARPIGRLQAFRPGAFRLALATGAPVVPVTIAGAFEAWPAGRRLPRTGRITVTYHAPVGEADLPPAADRKARPELLMALVRDRIGAALPV